MDKFIIIEVGSTNTKVYLYENDKIKDMGFTTIEFKNNYKKFNKIFDEDKQKLFEIINKFKEEKVYIYGTSIFRNLDDKEKEKWLKEFKDNTGFDFTIVDSDMENELTVYGSIANINYNGRIAVMIGGGGSTELSIIENKKIIEKHNYTFGVSDITEMYPDLKEDYATSNYDEMLNNTKKLINKPENKSDLLILAGGDFIYFYEELKYPVKENKFYKNILQPYYLNTMIMDEYDKKFFYETSLEEICKRTGKDGWWRGTRGMRICVKVLVDLLDVKYIIPTRISMVYGVVEKIKNN